MKKVRITVMRTARYDDLIEQYENPIGHACDIWMKNKKSAMLSCNDGFRPVSFLIEALDEEAGD